MRCRTCQQRIRRELDSCPYCGGRTKQASTGKTRHLSPQQLGQSTAPQQLAQPTAPPWLLTLLVLGALVYCMVWVVRWPLGTTAPHGLAMYAGFACAFGLPFAAARGYRWRSLLLACGAAAALVMRVSMG